MPDKSRIPRSIKQFNDYLRDTNTYQLAGSPANYTRWSWTPAESAAWTAFKNDFDPLYAKYSDKKASRTTDVKDQLLQIIDDCVEYDKEHHLLDRIASSPDSINTDFETFNIKRGTPLADTTPTRPLAPISEQVAAIFKQRGGGDIKISCRTGTDSKRASIPEGADIVQFVYQVGGTAPANPGVTSLIKESSSRAEFILHTGVGNAAKNLFIFFRWFNTKHAELAGPWSALQTAVIL